MDKEAENNDAQVIAQHLAEHENHRFHAVAFRGNAWDLNHLSPFAFKVIIENNPHIIIIVLFSCHCFTHAIKNDERTKHSIPPEELYEDWCEVRVLNEEGYMVSKTELREIRVLNEERYMLSKTELPKIMTELHQRHITVADEGKRGNFVTIEHINQVGEQRYYGVFFEVSKDKKRTGRIILRVQSAYLLNGLTKRQKAAKKVRFETLIKAEYEGRKIRP